MEEDKDIEKVGGFLVAFVVVWLLAGFAAFMMSLVCFAYSGTFLEKLGGFAIAMMFGPFYWIYFTFVANYCKRQKI